jgi:glycosyltransferase involved in cell wall biosynthesis
MIRLCFLIRQLTRGGAQRQLYELCRRLDRDRYAITVITFYEGGAFVPRFRALGGVRVRCAQKSRRWDAAGFLRRVAREVAGADPQIVHAYMGAANIVAMILKPLFPRSRTVLGVRSSQVDWSEHGLASRASFLVEGAVARRADLVIANSAAGRRLFEGRGVPAGKIAVIPNGIDTAEFSPRPEARRRTRAAWGIAEGETAVGLVGRLDRVKGHASLLHAAAELCRKGRSIRLVLAGGGPDALAGELHALAQALGIEDRVLWLGDRDDVAELYSALDLYVSASSSEGFPNAVAEAMASGVPCVATDVGDCRLLVGETGVVVPPGPEALAGGMEALLLRLDRDPERVRSEARARVVGEFSVERLVDRTERALAGVAEAS